MAEQQKQSSEPEFEGTPEEFFEFLKKRIQGFMPIQQVSPFKIIKFHEQGTKPEIKIENLVEFICEKSIDDIKRAMSNSVLYVDIRKAQQEKSFRDVIRTMGHGARPLAKAGIIDVLTVNIDEYPEGSLKEPIDIRKTRISDAFTEILGGATVSSVEQETREEEDLRSEFRIGKKHMSKEKKTDMRKQMEEAIDLKLDEKVVPRFDKIDNDLDEIKKTLKSMTPKL